MPRTAFANSPMTALRAGWLWQGMAWVSLIVGGAHSSAAGQSASAEPDLPALYSPAQVGRGRILYAARCAHCHGRDLAGGMAPALAGAQFFTRQMHNRLAGTFSYLVHEMPQDRPGSLTHEQYADIMALMLARNGFPAGAEALTYDFAMRSDVIVYFARQP